MVDSHLVRLASIRRRTHLVVAMALMAPLVSLALASPALALKGEFTVFSDCPLSNPELSGCLVAKTESGEVTLNKQTVPLKNTITLQGGFIENRETGAQTFVGASDGNTLSKTPQPVPGGLAGLVKCNEITEPVAKLACELVFQNGLTGVNAVTELAAPASSIGLNEENLLTATGTALSLPVKVRLENPFLGSSCYIGSNSNPIVLNLTTGTTSPPKPNEPITGKIGTFTSTEEGSILTISENTLVGNSFAAPGATGCAGLLAPVIDPLINAKIGLPAAAGHNTAILNNTLKQAGATAVREHE
ncbi:MAG TPA: hypothetical protein VGX26_10345 [Solirubrobacteraceae bacterium]|nr:hypothetical protein [Solirubrobacteraceae bacterium]